MSSARSNASAIQKRSQSNKQIHYNESLKFPRQEEHNKKISSIEAIIKLSETVKELKEQFEEIPKNNKNDQIENLEKNIENLQKSLGTQMIKTNDENKFLKGKVEQLEKTISDLQSLVNTLSTKILSKE